MHRGQEQHIGTAAGRNHAIQELPCRDHPRTQINVFSAANAAVQLQIIGNTPWQQSQYAGNAQTLNIQRRCQTHYKATQTVNDGLSRRLWLRSHATPLALVTSPVACQDGNPWSATPKLLTTCARRRARLHIILRTGAPWRCKPKGDGHDKKALAKTRPWMYMGEICVSN